MDTIRLRTLSYKSIFGFGKYSEMPVKYCIDNNFNGYLRWVYYNCSMISFLPEILDKINIKEEYRIPKPGINPELGEKLNEELHNKMSFVGKFRLDMHYRKVRKAKEKNRSISENHTYSKANMQRLNHGHYK